MAGSVLLILSCGTSDEDNSTSNNNSSKITPPAWIQGTWRYVDIPQTYSYRLTDNNICMVVQGSENCMKEYIELYENASVDVYTNVEQRISDTEYYCKITVSTASNIYHFQKLSDNTIKDVIMTNSVGSTVTLKKD